MHKAIIQILERLSEKEATLKRWKEQTHLSWILLGFASIFLIFLFVVNWWSFWLCLTLLIGAFVCWVWGGRSLDPSFDVDEVAHKIEESHPDLQSLLLTAVEQKPDKETGELNYLQDRVIKDAIDQAREQSWVEDVSSEEMRKAEMASRWSRRAAALVVFLPLLIGFGMFGPAGILPSSKPNKLANREQPVADEEIPATAVEVTPGNTEVEKGTRLPISALFGEDTLPVAAALQHGPSEDELQLLPMVKSLEDPLFGVILPEVSADFVYKIKYGDETTETFKITTFEYPRLNRANVTITPPSYVGGEPKVMKDVRKVTAFEDSLLEIELVLNKPVSKITLVGERSKEEVALTVSSDDASLYSGRMTAHESDVFVLTLEDDAGRPNKEFTRLELTVLRNEPPKVTAVIPKRDIQASALEEVVLKGKAEDDFGVLSYGLSYTYEEEENELKMGEGTESEPQPSVEMDHLLALEDLGAKEDLLLSRLWT